MPPSTLARLPVIHQDAFIPALLAGPHQFPQPQCSFGTGQTTSSSFARPPWNIVQASGYDNPRGPFTSEITWMVLSSYTLDDPIKNIIIQIHLIHIICKHHHVRENRIRFCQCRQGAQEWNGKDAAEVGQRYLTVGKAQPVMVRSLWRTCKWSC